MKKHLKKYFIPHAENNYHPHILHTKRAFFYGAVFTVIKLFLVGFVMFLPVQVFVLPDVLAEQQRQIISLTNAVREKNGKLALSEESKLDLSAQHKADDMAAKEYFAHSNDNRSLSSWLSGVGYKYQTAGENLAVGFTTAEEIVDAWVNSPTHYANLIDSDFKEFGVGLEGGVFEGQPTVYVAQHFGTPRVVVAEAQAKAPETKKVAAAKPEVKKTEPTTIPQVKLETKPEPVVTATETAPVQNSPEALPETEIQIASDTAQVLAEKLPEVQMTAPLIQKGAPTPIDKYMAAKSTLTPITSIFRVSRSIFLIAAMFFAIALCLKIFIEIKKQHPHVIVQTAMLIGLLVFFYKY